jgi:lipopolysaccharide export system protein LptC
LNAGALVPARNHLPAPDDLMTFDRGRQFRKVRRHSIWVRILRLLLPVVGIGTVAALIFVTTFMPSIGVDGLELDPGMTLSFNGSSIMMNNPKLSGFGDDGQSYEVMADSATQSILKPGLINLNGLFAKITLEDGTWADVRSQEGLYNNNSSELSIHSPIKVDSSEGYQVTLQNAEVDLKSGKLTSQSPVEVRSETGLMQANRLIIDNNGKRIRFTNGIRMTIVPPESGGKLIVQE